MVHDVRVVPLDDLPELPSGLSQWLGAARGRWEGDTLVVESRSFGAKTASFDQRPWAGLGSGEHRVLTERFTLIGHDRLIYEFIVEDPLTFTAPFTAAFPMVRTDQEIYEYACHEGNHAMINILMGARKAEGVRGR